LQLEKIQNKVLKIIFFTIFIDLIGFGMFLPILPQIAREFHTSDSQIAFLATWFAFASFISGGLLGYISDVFGRKKILLVTILISCLSQFLTGIANSYLFLVLAKILSGIGYGNIATAQACISDITSNKDRGRYMSIIGLAFGGGFTVGPIFGTLAVLTIDKFQLFQGSYLFGIAMIAVFLNILNLIFVAYYLPETHYKFANVFYRGIFEKINPNYLPNNTPIHLNKQSIMYAIKQILKIKVFIAFMVILFLQILAFSGVETLLPFILKDAYFFGNLEIYKSYIIIGLFSIIANAFIAKKILKNFKESLVLKWGYLLLILSMIGIPYYAPHPYFLVISLSFLCVGIAISNPAINTLISLSTPQKYQGFGFGIAQGVLPISDFYKA
jgi:DHA1 family tetracycline resistance protein-like MFS transporter